MITPEQLRTSMERGDLFMEYQPIVRLHDRSCLGAEALVRLRLDQHVIPPSKFVPHIENTPLSGLLTYWVIDTIEDELGEWLGGHPDASISINVPPEVLGRGGLEYAASRSGLKARIDQIVLEITERGVPDRLGMEALHLLAERGVRLALDDTMLSGANLALLARCDFRVIKLDRHLVAELEEGSFVPEWLTGLASLLTSSSLQVVAEGIETNYQAMTLTAMGVQFGQGHLYSASLPAADFIKFWDESTLISGRRPADATVPTQAGASRFDDRPHR